MQYFHAVSTSEQCLAGGGRGCCGYDVLSRLVVRVDYEPKQITVYNPAVFVADERAAQTGTSRLLGNRNARRLSRTKEILEFNVSGLDSWRSCSDIDRLPRRNALGLSPRL